jgi:hypothetical protein
MSQAVKFATLFREMVGLNLSQYTEKYTEIQLIVVFYHWGDQDVDRRIILRWIFRKLEGVVGTGRSWLRIGTGGGHLWVR